jgi:hypothetical protein
MLHLTSNIHFQIHETDSCRLFDVILTDKKIVREVVGDDLLSTSRYAVINADLLNTADIAELMAYCSKRGLSDATRTEARAFLNKEQA